MSATTDGQIYSRLRSKSLGKKSIAESPRTVGEERDEKKGSSFFTRHRTRSKTLSDTQASCNGDSNSPPPVPSVPVLRYTSTPPKVNPVNRVPGQHVVEKDSEATVAAADFIDHVIEAAFSWEGDFRLQDRLSEAPKDRGDLVDAVARLDADTGRELADQSNTPKDNRPAVASPLLSPPVTSPLPSPFSFKLRSPVFEKLNSLVRGRKSNTSMLSPALSSYTSPDYGSVSTPDTMLSPWSVIEHGGKGMAPQMDAPISASNGGERVS
jgi:hypothetical protein